MATVSIAGSSMPHEALRWRAVELAERVAAGAALAALAPGLVGVAAAIAVLSRRAPLILHRRVGRLGSTLWMLKFRTMWDEAAPSRRRWIEYIEDDGGPASKRPGDARVTSRFAAFCRRHSIDELPQLWHVVTGEMALIGPRPLTAVELRAHYDGAAAEVLTVKPGIAGLWQTCGRNRLTYEERRELDLAFVRHRSLGMYARILVRSFGEIWSGANTC